MAPATRSRAARADNENSPVTQGDRSPAEPEPLELPQPLEPQSPIPEEILALTEDPPSPTELPLPLPNTSPTPEDDDVILDRHGRAFAKIIASAMSEAMAQALKATQPTPPNESTKYPKAKDPGMFNGKRRRYLRTWIGENEICFRTAPNLYRTEVSKVMFAGSFLEGDAKTWFTDYFRDPANVPAFMSDWTLFTIELQRNFGLEDELGAAEEDLQNLTMVDKDHATYFTARFRAIVSTLEGTWDDRNLRNVYYKKIAPRLQAQFVSSGTPVPATLEPLIAMVDRFDRAYWANHEMIRSQPISGLASGVKPFPPASAKSTAKSPVTSPMAVATATSAPANRSPATKNTSASHLTAEGKLTAEEKQKRFEKGACLYCGEVGHLASQCTKKVAARARIATPTVAPATPSAAARASITVQEESEESGKD
jgi:hypothetical protein